MSIDAERIAAALPNYEFRGEIGRGAWGVVLAAEHRQLGRGVAVKQLPPAFAANPAIQRRFAAEARVLASLDHPHIVPIFDYVEQDGLWLLVMELLTGGTVRDRLGSEGIGAEVACGIALATCAALYYAHGKGILHRDIKPENLLFNASGTLKVSDFGIAKVLGGAETLVTMTGDVLGTPAFMAPEQVSGGVLSPATDVYAVATMLYELLSGYLPFSEEGGLISILFRHVYELPTPLHDVAPQVPEPLASVIMQGLATAPDERFPSADDFGVALVDAANQSWGSNWLTTTELEVVTSKRVAQRISGEVPGTVVRPYAGLPRVVVRMADPTSPPARVTEPASPGQVMGLAELLARDFGSPPPSPPAPPTPAATAAPVRRRGRWPWAVGGLAVVVAAAVIVLLSRHTSGTGPGALGAASTTSSSAASATTAAPNAAGRVVFSDNFTDSSSGWAADANQPGAGTAEYRPDGYYLTALKAFPVLNTFSAASPYATRLNSLLVSVEVTLVNAARSDGAGVRCDQGGRNGLRYTFEVFGDGTWVIFKLDTTGSGVLKMGSSPAINSGTVANTVIGECTETGNTATTLTMTVNGVPVATVADTHAPGAIAWHAALTMYRAAASPGTVVRFNNFVSLVPKSS